MTNSVSLIGWGLDCAIEAAACLVIIWRFSGARVHSGDAERLAQRVVAVSFVLLAPYVIAGAVHQLVTGEAAGASWIGIGLAATDAMFMPLLGGAKKRLGHSAWLPATTGGGKQNILCAYLSVGVLAGLAGNALADLWWADPAAALAVAIAALQAGARVWRGSECG